MVPGRSGCTFQTHAQKKRKISASKGACCSASCSSPIAVSAPSECDDVTWRQSRLFSSFHYSGSCGTSQLDNVHRSFAKQRQPAHMTKRTVRKNVLRGLGSFHCYRPTHCLPMMCKETLLLILLFFFIINIKSVSATDLNDNC